MGAAENTAVGLFAFGGFVLLTILVIRMVVFYKAPSIPFWLTSLVFVSWLFGFGGLLLLPADVAVAANGDSDDSTAYDTLWNLIYWSTFVLSWVVTPVLLQYALAGDFTWKQRLNSALKANLMYYVVSVILIIIVGIYILATSHYSMSALLGFLIAYANTYGMVLIVLLLGHGLVAFPRKLWEMASPVQEVETFELTAPYADHELYDALFELEDCELEVKRLKDTVDDYERTRTLGDVTRLKDYVRQLQETVDRFEYANQMRSMSKLNNKNKHVAKPAAEPAISETMCVQLNTRLRRAQELVFRARRRMQAINEAYAKAVEEIEQSVEPPLKTSAGNASCCDKCSSSLYYCAGWLLWKWRTHLKGFVLKGLAAVCGFLSLLLLWCEVTMVAPINLSPFGLLLSSVDVNSVHSSLVVQMLTWIPLVYMGTCMYWSLFRLKIVRSFSLEGPALSSEASLLFNAQMLVRLQFSLCYNYIRLLKYSPAKHTAFTALMHDMTIAPILGTSFNVYAPIMLVILAGFTLFNGYPRLLKLIGLVHEDAAFLGDEDELKERRTEGKRILKNNLKSRSGDANGRRGESTSNGTGTELVRTSTVRSANPFFSKFEDDDSVV